MFAASTWSFDAEVRYHGLMNLGKTCYLNSVLQVLFMTEDFREAVNSPSNTEFIDNHLRDLFDHLVNENSDPLEIITALGIDTVYEQRDAAEYFQKILRLTSPEAAKIFHGELTNRRICFSCGTTTDTDEPFWLLPLSLVTSPRELYSVEDSISEFFNTSYFSGENQIYCKHCDTKVDACTNYVVKHHPEVLILMLKRFDFSYKYMRYIKINDAVHVPTFLEIPENQTYELYAVVDHFGDLRGGHYCSRIRSQDDSRWYEFNDTWVTPVDYNMERDIKRSNTAFLLFYRKKDTRTEQVMKASSYKDDRPVNSDNYYQNLMADDEAKTQRAEDGSEDVSLCVCARCIKTNTCEAEIVMLLQMHSINNEQADSGVPSAKAQLKHVKEICKKLQNNYAKQC